MPHLMKIQIFKMKHWIWIDKKMDICYQQVTTST